VAAARLDGYAQREVGVGVFLGDGFEAVGGAGGDVDGHCVAVIVFARVCDCDGGLGGCGGEGAAGGFGEGGSLEWSEG